MTDYLVSHQGPDGDWFEYFATSTEEAQVRVQKLLQPEEDVVKIEIVVLKP